MFPLLSRTVSYAETRKKIDMFLEDGLFAHIVSLNPENTVLAYHNKAFSNTCEHAEILLVDGVGMTIASKMLTMPCGERITGVDLMRDIVLAHPLKKIVFVGGKQGSAQKTLEFLLRQTKVRDVSWVAFSDVNKKDPDLIKKILSVKPEIMFVAFGSPFQELWIESHRQQLHGVLCMGVGQGFDVYAGIVPRAPRIMQITGLEWLFRLVIQPWRWRRQLKLFEFIYLVVKYRFGGKSTFSA